MARQGARRPRGEGRCEVSSVPAFALNCSFCGKHQAGTAKLVVGAIASIFRECISLCAEIAEIPKIVVADGAPVMLGAAPIGLFLSVNGELCLKTEYRTAIGKVEAYIVSSGEAFGGSPPQTVESQLQEKVRPVRITSEAQS